MPIYTYECPKCKIMEDKFLKIEEATKYIEESCCICGASSVQFKKVPTAPSRFHLIGKGFYKETSKFD